jgi:hypothetical protein
MFNLETTLRVLALLVGVALVASYYVNPSYIISKLLNMKKNKSLQPIGNDKFIQIIDLWYKLRNECVNSKLGSAKDKLDEVFPLLNDKSQSTVVDTTVKVEV